MEKHPLVSNGSSLVFVITYLMLHEYESNKKSFLRKFTITCNQNKKKI